MNFSPEKLLLVGVIALVVLGPTRLPQAARTLGRFVSEMRRMSASFQTEVRDAIGEPWDALHGAVGDMGLGGFTDLRQSLRNTVTEVSSAITGDFGSTSPAQPGAPARDAGAEPVSRTVALPPAPDDPSLN